MTRKQIFTSIGVVLVLLLVIVLVLWGPSALWQMLLAMHGR